MRVPFRALSRALALGFVVAAAPVALAGDPPKDAPKPVKPHPVMATDADAAAAVAKFKEDFKAKGLKGDDRLSQRDFAMAELAKLQHPLVVEALAPVSRDPDEMLRMLATVYLGDETLLPGLAGKHVAAAWRKGTSDDAFVITAMQSIAKLRYLGARDEIRTGLKSQSFPVKKVAIGTIVMTGDLRLVRDMLALVGVQIPAAQGAGAAAGGPAGDTKSAPATTSGTTETTEGYSWEGAEATVDYGMEDNSQENAEAEAKVKEQIEKNKAAAASGASGNPTGGTSAGGSGGNASGGAAGDSSGGTGPGRGGGRSNSELLPHVLGALQRLTGQTFSGPAHFKKWWADNAAVVAEKMKKLDDKEKFQKEEAAAQVK